MNAAAGGGHTCSVREADHTVWCWGRNDVGQLGNDGNTDSNEPVQVRGIEDAIAVATGASHSCALLEDRTVKCWGLNDRGQLGNNANTDSKVPVVTRQLAGIVELVAGADHNCARTESGAVWCWGSDDRGQAGVAGPEREHALPVEIGITATRVAAGAGSTCAIAPPDGALWCWGANNQRMFAEAGDRDVPKPVMGFDPDGDDVVAPMTSVTSVDVALEHLCAVTTVTGIGAVWCVGSSRNGRLGDGSFGDQPFNTDKFLRTVGITEDVVEVATSDEHSCAMSNTGGVWCWGADYLSQFGDVNQGERGTPTKIDVPGAAGLALGRRHTCIRDQKGAIWCVGDNPFGQLANGERTSQPRPLPVPGLSDIVLIAAGGNRTCAADRDGITKCWGSIYFENIAVPTLVPALPAGATGLAVGDTHACAIANNEVWCWGDGRNGKLGDGIENRVEANKVPGITVVPRQLAAASAHTCVLGDNGAVQCWGRNAAGQLGIPISIDKTTPQLAPHLQGVLEISIGTDHSCAIMDMDRAKCWGSNESGQLGGGDTVPSSEMPVTVLHDGVDLRRVTRIDAGGSRTYALVDKNGDGANDAVASWGLCSGASGSTDIDCTKHATAQYFDAAFDEIAVGGEAACARGGESVSCWGRNHLGQLGVGTYTPATTPARLELSGAAQLVSGNNHACVRHVDGTVSCWGNNAHGQLGDGAVTRRDFSGARLVCK